MRRIEVKPKGSLREPASYPLKKEIEGLFKVEVADLMITKAYTIDADLSDEEMERLGKELFADRIAEEYSFSGPCYPGAWRIEVGLLPGMTDNVGKTAKKAVADILGKDQDVYYSRVYYIDAELEDEEALDELAGKLLANRVIERWRVYPPKDSTFEPFPAKVELGHSPEVEEINLDIGDDALAKMSKERLLALSLEEMKGIKEYYKQGTVQEQREKVGLGSRATDVELEALAQSWSEHCKHKIFNATIEYSENGELVEEINSIFKTYIRGATEKAMKPYVISVFKDNGGIIKFNLDHDVAVKVETHNAPSALDPYGGAITGILGVNRDVLGTGMGAKPVANMDMLCFGHLDEKDVPEGVMHPKRIAEGVIKGIKDGGNPVGIPTVNGSIVFEKCYTARPLVYAGTVGIMPNKVEDRPTAEKKIEPGYLAVMVGGKIGKDGIHGATFSSQELTTGISSSVVQIGDAITQKKVIDFVLEARDKMLFEAITDNGAGGLSSSIGELAQLSGGCEIYLDRCPLKYPGLDPWEILLSESQERMTLAVPKERWGELEGLAKKHDVEATVVGTFTGSGYFHILYNEETVGYLMMEFLHEGMGKMKLRANWEKKIYPDPNITDTDPNDSLMKLLAQPNIASKEWVIRQYDHEVQGGSVVKPIMCNNSTSDAAVIRPILDWEEGLVVSHGICPRQVEDSYHMAQLAVDEAVRNAIATGAMFGYLACLDNFSWPDPIKSEKTPDGEYKLAQLVRCVKGLHDAAVAYGCPLISGKDSMKNEYTVDGQKYAVNPTLLVTVVGKIQDVEEAVTVNFKEPGDLVYVLGKTKGAMGGSEYFKLYGGIGNGMPTVDLQANIGLYSALSKAAAAGLVSSAHDISDGGLAVAFAECTMAGLRGADLDLGLCEAETDDPYCLLFSEDPGRFIVTVRAENEKKFEKIMAGTPFRKAGRVRGDRRMVIRQGEKVLVNQDASDVKAAWRGGLKW
ncbi:phosphoribosylformylglycinamidine synthase subunit PurL [Candidatus Micrarchaeota archaeon]|nr:phosphoribosylformylglycinamidine synthase subunit PurL [Candidatus Micrarchaeota archaeon]MBD3417721.1 phosphoribosylformylglycinamidine synthase subunit PurL [Candidatus Micrarchaeota archaeon]